MNNSLFKYYVLLLISFGFIIFSCKQPQIFSFEGILYKHQWRKIKEAVYNSNNEFEKYTYLIENAQDCEKNSFWDFGKPGDYSNMNYYDLCNNIQNSFLWKVESDSLIFNPWNFDTLHVKFSRFIEYYDTRSFVLRYDTLINNSNKIIKETYWALDLNKQK